MHTAEVPDDPRGSRPGGPPPPAGDRVYADVKAGILDRTIPGGSLLTEGEIADRVGVSRTPVREGLLKLAAEGLVHLIPKRGALVVPVSPAEVEDVLEARELVEVHTARRAWPARSQFVDDLEACLQRMRAAEDAGDVWEFMTADRSFHAVVVRAAGNEVLSGLYDSLRDKQMRMGVATMTASAERMTHAVGEHTGLVAALRGDDVERWIDLVRLHVRQAGDRLRSLR